MVLSFANISYFPDVPLQTIRIKQRRTQKKRGFVFEIKNKERLR
jgi:hypothetical protein